MKLQGLKVLDLSAFLPGPHMTMMMADHCADVVMVEHAIGVGEPTRVIGAKTEDGG
ncbi:MAG: CoA transferase, partial [Hyphomonadaceae bacterium]